MGASTAPGLSDALAECARACRVLKMERHGEMTLGHLSLRDPYPLAARLKCNGQIMTPVHWEHSSNYFCRKLAACAAAAGGPGKPIFE